MSAILQTVKLGDIRPNPFRDIEHYPIDRVKVELLRQSFERTGFWEGYLMVRLAEGVYEQAFGHHRVIAAIELWGKDHEVPVVVKDLSDDMMLAMMAHENNEHFAQYFYLSVMEPIEAVVKAYAEGRVELEALPSKATARRFAPSFCVSASVESNSHAYTAETVAKFLGWAVKDRNQFQASDRVKTALAALELIEKKVLTRQQFLSLTQTQADALVGVTRATIKAREADAEADARVHMEAAAKAKKDGNERKAEEHKATAERARENADESALKAAKAVAAQVADRFASGERVRDVLEDTVAAGVKASQRTAARTQERTQPSVCTADEAEGYALRLDKLATEEDRERLAGCRSAKAKAELAGSVKRLRERLALLLKEIQ